MKILIVTQYFWPESFRINDVATGLVEKGHEVTVLTGKPNYPQGKFYKGYGLFKKPKEEYENVNIIRVPMFPRGKNGIFKLVFNYISYAFSASLLAPFLCKKDYDCILVYQMSPVIQGIPAIVLKKLYKIPVLFWVQDLWPESLMAVGAVNNKKVLNLLSKLVGWLYRSSDKVLIQSEAFYEHVLQHGINKSDVCYLPNSAEELYKPVVTSIGSEVDKLIPKGFVVMFAGNVGVAQDMENILKAAEITAFNHEIHWVIVGDGRELVRMQSEIKLRQLTKTVHCLGRYPIERMPEFFSHADVMLVSLTNDPIFALTIPAKIQSYMACGKPIIASLDGIGAEVIEKSQAGFVAGAEQPDKLAAVVLEAVSLPQEELDKMGENALNFYMDNFERNMLLRKLEDIMQSLHTKSEK